MDVDDHVQLLPQSRQAVGELREGHGAVLGVGHHDHGEEVLGQDGLGDVQDVDVLLGEPAGDGGDDAKAAATFVTDAVMDNGIFNAFKKLNLI